MSGPRPGPRGWWDRILASRHRRSILGSLAVLALLLVVIVVGLIQGDQSGRGTASGAPPVAVLGVSHGAGDHLRAPTALTSTPASVALRH